MTLAYDDAGHGTPVILLHAFPLSRALWRRQTEVLRTICRVLTPDLPGFGDSPLLDGPPTVEAMADAVAELLDALAVREPVVLGGLSMGGYVSFAFVRKYPDRVRALVLADTRAEPDDDAAKANRDRMIGFASTNPASAVVEQMVPKLLGPRTLAERPEVVAEVKRIGSAQRPAAIIAALQGLRNRPDATPTLSSLRVPTLILVGRDDSLTPPVIAEAMAAKVAEARLVVIDGAGHLPNLEAPEAFNEALRAFIRDVI
jgi:pimeloyl-ACP methyl ester carboxylesterase